MRRTRKFLIVITSIVVLSNVVPITGLFQFFLDQRHYRYSNYNGSLTFTEYWSRGFQMMKNRHRSCLKAKPDLKDKQLYRLFSKDPLAFWRLRLYFFNESYKLPYRDWPEIKKVGEKERVKEITGCPIEF